MPPRAGWAEAAPTLDGHDESDRRRRMGQAQLEDAQAQALSTVRAPSGETPGRITAHSSPP